MYREYSLTICNDLFYNLIHVYTVNDFCPSIFCRTLNDVSDLSEVYQAVNLTFEDIFTPTELLVATWSNVGYYNAQSDKVYTTPVTASMYTI